MAPGLNLPPPSNGVSSKQATVEDVQDSSIAAGPTAGPAPTKSSNRFATGGIIYPPPEIRNIIDKTASFIARLGKQFEERMRNEDKVGKLSFLNEDDPYHAYYLHTLEHGGADGAKPDASATDVDAVQVAKEAGQGDGEKAEDAVEEPSPFLFSAELPSTTAVDLDILKLTALFTATRGRNFTSEILTRESKSFQFDFLRPTHSLFPFFNRLVEQYRLVVEAPEEVRNTLTIEQAGEPSAATLVPKRGAGAGGLRQALLKQVQARAEWEKKIQASRKKKADEEAETRAAFDEIDWQDFVVAQTVEITETDMHIDLPLPMSIRDVESMTLAQKKLASMIMDPDGDDVQGQGGLEEKEDEMEMESDDEREPAAAEQKPVQVVKTSAAGDIKVRKNYVPRALAQKQQAEAVTTCPVCGQQVPLKEMDEHVRIELLNPQFRDQRRDLEARQAQHKALQSGADPVSALKQYAGARTDIFGAENDEAARRQREEAERRAAKEKEKYIYDGHLASKATTLERAQKLANSDEAVRAREQSLRQAAAVPVIGPRVGAPDAASGQIDSLKRPADGPAPGEPAAQRLMTTAGLPAAPANLPQRPMAPEMPTGSPVEGTTAAVSIQLPNSTAISPLCDGRVISLQPLPLTTTISHIRDIVQADTLQTAVGASRIKLRVNGKATTLKQTLAELGLRDGSQIEIQIK